MQPQLSAWTNTNPEDLAAHVVNYIYERPADIIPTSSLTCFLQRISATAAEGAIPGRQAATLFSGQRSYLPRRWSSLAPGREKHEYRISPTQPGSFLDLQQPCGLGEAACRVGSNKQSRYCWPQRGSLADGQEPTPATCPDASVVTAAHDPARVPSTLATAALCLESQLGSFALLQ